MKRIKIWRSFNLHGTYSEEIIEVDDDVTDDDCEREAREYMLEQAAYGWEPVGDSEGQK